MKIYFYCLELYASNGKLLNKIDGAIEGYQIGNLRQYVQLRQSIISDAKIAHPDYFLTSPSVLFAAFNAL